MTDKSHVSMEQQVCQVCGHTFDTGAILLDERLQPSMERNTITGYGLCPDHQKLFDEGYIALVAVEQPDDGKTHLKQEEAQRTGALAHLRRTVANEIFNTTFPDNLAMVFCEEEVINKLKEMTKD